MAITSINTSNVNYIQMRTNMNDLISWIVPKIKRFDALTRDQQKWWLQRDPLLREVLSFARSVSKNVSILDE